MCPPEFRSTHRQIATAEEATSRAAELGIESPEPGAIHLSVQDASNPSLS